ncbi:MAG: hypothetical protein HOW97_07980 [Catenulispora sp.]|nr:hypothetical protein [Catenulispora sp.]
MPRVTVGFLNGEPADPAEQGLTPTSSFNVAPGETVTETTPDGTTHTYTATGDTQDK